MSVPTGQKLAHYEIQEPIGKGGMGEVYRARDGKLGRDVAIKVLPDEFAQDDERLRRFQREAKVLASLNHPNIASIYGVEHSDDTHYLVLELVPGETLAERIAQGPIPLDEALDIASKIADALEQAHEQGIVHRDLKPANVKLTEDGKVIVLDFGLAKAFGEDASDTDSSLSPTITRDATRVGVILGTAAYMSPEQAKGKRVDKRADVWAFGALLYEMLTGAKAFAGEDVSDTLAYVLTKEPHWDALPTNTPAVLKRTLKLCLTKDAKRRVRDIGDVSLAMEGAFGADSVEVSHPAGLRSMVLVGIAGLVLGAVAVALFALGGSDLSPAPVARFAIDPSSRLLGTLGPPLLAISPDGGTVVYTGTDQLYRRDLGELESRPIPNTESGNSPFFSPDGKWIGFQTGDRRALKKVSLSGGPAVTLAETSVAGASWGADDKILFGVDEGGLMSVSPEGGELEVVTEPTDGELGHYRPNVLPNGAVLFTIWTRALESSQIAVVSPESGEQKVLTNGSYPRYVSTGPTGYLVFARESSLWAASFDLKRLELTGSPATVVDRVSVAPGSGAAQFAISQNGSLLYVSGEASELRTLVWVDRAGREEPLTAEPRAYVYPRISPNGGRIALDVRDGAESDIWMWDVARETSTRFTFEPGLDVFPTWTPDGGRLAFSSGRAASLSVLWKAADGTGRVEQLMEGSNPRPLGFTPDGTGLILSTSGARSDIWLLTLGGAAEPLLDSPFGESNATISPDGRWLAYESDASGLDQVYVTPFPNVDEGQWQISRELGRHPAWSADGSELYYVDEQLTQFSVGIMAVPIETEPAFAPGNPELLFEGDYFAVAPGRTFDVAPDGRFLMVKKIETTSQELVLVQNWFQELERLVPSN